MNKAIVAAAAALFSSTSFATTGLWDLSSSDFFQDWSNTNLITADDDWSGVASVMGYRGDGLTGGTNTDPQTILAAGDLVVDVNANEAATTLTSGGVGEFEIANPVVALQGSGTADAPSLNFFMNAAGRTNVSISYVLRDIDENDDAVQQVVLQYRTSDSSDFANVAGTYVADATAGGGATMTTNISATSGAWDNQGYLEFRVLTTNAGGSDEWVGVDDISITSEAVPEPATMTLLGLGIAAFAARKRKKA